jgi:hypothetical protein
MDERIRRTMHELAGLIESMAKEDHDTVLEIDSILKEETPRRRQMKAKLESIRASAARIRKETRR